ncbi:BQ5605_C038g11739 [Microbotryum silenes-dioicae]|uniref:BQ5605_C007g04363 protein n=1 Tax=Microbotryum silenes-dioicae TaxID=796604 RepID=A0A2X0P920_9BASI|nr:BQ5605_C007g04363 [Microbotryum silenes-dioicae]SGY92439.1 BQ5605_C038g11739 [Microbotryum silenes-dioicae]
MARGLAQHGGWCGLQHVHLSPGLTTFCSLPLSVVYLDSKPSDHTICCLSCLLPVTHASVQSTSSPEMGSVLTSSATVQTQQHHISASSIAEDGRSTTLASRPTTSNSSNSMSHRIEEVQDEIRALHDAVRALPSTSRLSSSQKEIHVLYNLQRRLEKMQYCLRHGVRDDDLDSYTPPATRSNDRNDWNDFKTSRFFRCLLEKNGLEGKCSVCLPDSSQNRLLSITRRYSDRQIHHSDPYKVPKDFSALQAIGSRYWEQVKNSPELWEQWKEARASEARDRKETAQPLKRWRIDSATISKLRRRYENAMNELVEQYAEGYGFDALVIVSSNKLEDKNDRFIVSTLGGAAFMRRQGWDSDQQKDILVNFTDCVNGTRFNQEQNEQYKMRANHGDVDKASQRVLCAWYSIIIDDHYSEQPFHGSAPTFCSLVLNICGRADQALRRRHQRNRSTQPYVLSKLTSYNQATLAKDPIALIVEFGNGLQERDFRSPTNGKKPTVADLRRIIPLMRQGGLTFSLKEEIGQGSFDRTRAEGTVTTGQLETEPEDQVSGSDSASASDLGSDSNSNSDSDADLGAATS